MKNRQTVGPNMRRMVCAFFLAAVLALSGCATPVGVRPLDSQEANRRLTETVLSDAKLSAPTVQILNRAGLEKQFQSEPAETIAALHQALPTAREADRLFALAELSFLHAAKSGDRSYFLAAAVYAYAFLFPQGSGASPDPFDPRFRTAVDLYNRGITGGFAEPENRQVLIPERRRVILEEGVYRLPFGELSVRIDPDEFRYGPFRMVNFVDTAELEVRGLRNTYRWPGIGASLVAALKHRPGEQEREFAMVPATLRVAATAFLRLENVEEGIRTGRMEGRLTLHTTQEETSVTVGGRTVPLEYALTAALADTLEGSQAYALELKGLLSGDFADFEGHRPVQGQRVSHGAVPSRPDPAGARSRNGFQPGAMGADAQRNPQRPGIVEPLPGLAVHLQHRQPDSVLRRDPHARPAQRGSATRPRGHG